MQHHRFRVIFFQSGKCCSALLVSDHYAGCSLWCGRKLHPAAMVIRPNITARDGVFSTLRMMWCAAFISAISAIGCGWATMPKNIESACVLTLSSIILWWVSHLVKHPACVWLSFLLLSPPAASVWWSFLLACFFLLLLPPFSFYLANPSTCSLLPVFVFLSVSLLVLRTVTFFPPIIASLLVYRVWTTFQKWNSKTSQAIWWQVLKVL